jgi:hypothetical protein
MLERERGKKEQEFVSWKHLKLIGMEEAGRLDVAAECPVFVSPEIRRKEICRCGAEYSPIIYKKGEIKAQHYHPFSGGGIYFYVSSKIDFREQIETKHGGWKALLKSYPELNWAPANIRSAKVDVLSIQANCAGTACCNHAKITEGLVAKFNPVGTIGLSLAPFCDSKEQLSKLVQPPELGFKITEEGEVLFFKLPQQTLDPQPHPFE